MALNGLICADVPLSNYSLTHSAHYSVKLHARVEFEPHFWLKLHFSQKFPSPTSEAKICGKYLTSKPYL